jgi:hypothetical protein
MMVSLLLELGRDLSNPLRCEGLLLGIRRRCPCILAKSPCIPVFAGRDRLAPDRLADYGFKPGNYSKVVVTWGWTEEAAREGKSKNVILWDFRDLTDEIAEVSRHQRSHFTDDTIRTLQLCMRAMGHRKQSVAKGRES